jgi:tetratricopeptide (TPR) repeat protein
MKTRSPYARNPYPSGRDAEPDNSPEAAFVRALVGAWNSAKPHLNTGALILLAVLVVIAVVFGVNARRRATVARGYAAVASAESTDELLDVAKEFAGTGAGAQASMSLARRLFEEGKYAQAATRFSLFCQEYPEHAEARAARIGEAYALEGDGKLVQAEKRFRDIAAEAEAALQTGVRVDALCGAGRCAKTAGKLAAAEELYRQALEAVPAGRQRDRLADIVRGIEFERKHPRPEKESTEEPAAEAEGAAAEPAQPAAEEKAAPAPAK